MAYTRDSVTNSLGGLPLAYRGKIVCQLLGGFVGITGTQLIERAEAEYDKIFRSSGARSFDTNQALMWIKDACDEISDVLGIPRKSGNVSSVLSQNDYDLPSDIHDGVTSIISITYNGKPLHKRTLKYLQDCYGDEYLNPSDLDDVTFWFVNDSDDKFAVVPPPATTTTNAFKLIYVYSTTQLADVNSELPDIFTAFLSKIPIYLVAKMGGADKQKNFENRKLAEFRDSLTLRNARRKREGRTAGTQVYSAAFDTYNRNYGKRSLR